MAKKVQDLRVGETINGVTIRRIERTGDKYTIHYDGGTEIGHFNDNIREG